jgi:hypothetical protein
MIKIFNKETNILLHGNYTQKMVILGKIINIHEYANKLLHNIVTI